MKINRRRWSALVWVSSAMSIGLFATACGGTSTSGSGDAPESATFVYAIPQDFQGVDRASYSSEAAKTIGDVMHSRLLELATDGTTPTSCMSDVPTRIEAGSPLVDRWHVTDDGMGIDITLKPGVRSAQGNVLTAADVVWTMDRAKAIDTGAQTLFFNVGGFDRVNTVTVKSPTELTFNLTKPSAISPYVLAGNSALILDSTAAKANATADDPWATKYLTDHTANFGPWDLTGFDSQQLTFSRNPNYAGERGNIDSVVLKTVSDSSTRIQLIQSAQVSETNGLDYSQLAQLKSSSGVGLVQCQSPARDWLGLNGSDPVLGKPEVRAAISLALDRTAISQAVYRDFARPSESGLSQAFATQAGSNYETDKVKARELLEKAGVPEGFGFRLSVSAAQPGPYSANLAVLIQRQLADVGLKVEIVNVPSAVQFKSDGLAHKMQAWLQAETPAFANAGYSAWLTAGCAGLQNYMGYCNPELDAVASELMVNSQSADAAQKQQRLSQIIDRDQPAIYLIDRSTISVRSRCAESVPTAAFGTDYTKAVVAC
ncbi:ABC transporter substrate-binding protein [Nocardia sp. NBC_00416]|uniref:ABC transporter substrate-binding protein n=1 Tax=Nocardia sp. NBC_00416 TaxID=2975991 RepID=UPI002E23A517